MESIRIKPNYSAIIHSPDMVELRQGVWNSVSHLMRDDSAEGVLANIILGLHEQCTPADISIKTGISRSKVESVLDYLQQLGVLQAKSESFIDYYVDNVIPAFRRPGQYKYQLNLPVVFLGDAFINNKIRQQLVSMIDYTSQDSDELWSFVLKSSDDWLFDALEQQRFLALFQPWQNKFLVYTSRHINPVIATRLNRIAYMLNIPWIHLAIDGPFILIGPTFQGEQGPCYDCFETRVSMNLREAESYQKYKNAIAKNQVRTQQDDPLLQLTSSILATHATLEIMNYLSTQCTFTTNKVLSIFLPTMEFVYHDLLRLPACRTCGSVSHRDDTQLHFDFQTLIGEVA